MRIRENEANNQKFNFLNPNDPYHAYYQHKLKEYREGEPPELGRQILSPMVVLFKWIEFVGKIATNVMLLTFV